MRPCAPLRTFRQRILPVKTCNVQKSICLKAARCDSEKLKLPNVPRQGSPSNSNDSKTTQIQEDVESHMWPVLIPRRCRRGQKMPKSNLTRFDLPCQSLTSIQSNLDHLLPQTWHSPPLRKSVQLPGISCQSQTDSQTVPETRAVPCVGSGPS